jgi:hypothetical protein
MVAATAIADKRPGVPRTDSATLAAVACAII